MQLTVREVAQLLEVPEKLVYRWVTERQLPGYPVGGQYRFNRAELLEWATANGVPVSPRLFQSSEKGAERPPRLVDALEAGGVFHSLAATDKESALRSIVAVLPLPADADREFLFQVLLAREALESTGVGDGIAIPHVRNPIVLRVGHPLVTLCYLAQPVPFGALDGQPVHACFTLISPTVKSHLHLLSRLAFGLRDPALKALIGRQAGAEEVLEAVRRLGEGTSRGAAGARTQP